MVILSHLLIFCLMIMKNIIGFVITSVLSLHLYAGEPDYNTLEQLTKMANEGSVYAQVELGSLYSMGFEVPKNNKEALKWYTKAAEKTDDPSVMLNLADFLAFSDKDVRNFSEAANWYQKAAELGNDAAQYRLGHLYAQGRGVAKDKAKAIEWLEKAAAQGYPNAKYNLVLLQAQK